MISDFTLDAKRKKELKDTLDEVYFKTKCSVHQEEYCLIIYGDDPEKHVFLTESMLKVWASYIVSIFFFCKLCIIYYNIILYIHYNILFIGG
jgi:hypothetical protein